MYQRVQNYLPPPGEIVICPCSYANTPHLSIYLRHRTAAGRHPSSLLAP